MNRYKIIMVRKIKIRKIVEIVYFALIVSFFIIFINPTSVIAEKADLMNDKSFLPVDTIVLDESSAQELVYISPDHSILVFRRTTPQLADLRVGDVLFLDTEVTKNHHFLGQIMNLIREGVDQKGMIIHLITWRENHPPVISGLIAQPSILETGQQSRLTCHVADKDGDLLFYNWYANKGLLKGTGASVTWTAPHQPGDYFISCEVADNRGGKDNRTVRIQVVSRLPLLTYQEKELIRQFGWGQNRTIRWSDGYVAVYDSTHFSRMQEVLDAWNKVIGDDVIFYLSHNPQSPVKISYNDELSRKNLCYHIDTHWRNFQLYAAEIQINPDSWLCGYPRNLYAAYLHSFSGVAGFNVWRGKTVERDDWQDFILISEIMQHMIKALYIVPPGYELN